MIVDWLVYGLIVWVVPTVLNKTVFSETGASRLAAWGLTVVVFFINALALSALKFLRYQLISEDIGVKITPSTPLDITSAFVFAYLFFVFLKKKPK